MMEILLTHLTQVQNHQTRPTIHHHQAPVSYIFATLSVNNNNNQNNNNTYYNNT